MGLIKWIQQWFVGQCNGDWEHGYGITIKTLDNPGWSVKISLENNDLKDKSFQNIDIKRNETDWIFCKIDYDEDTDGQYFYGHGGPENLEEILNVFKSFLTDNRISS